LRQVPPVEPDGPVFAVQPRRVDWVRALLVHPARLLQGHKSFEPFLTPSVLLTWFDP
jgi:hypothetical protein